MPAYVCVAAVAEASVAVEAVFPIAMDEAPRAAAGNCSHTTHSVVNQRYDGRYAHLGDSYPTR